MCTIVLFLSLLITTNNGVSAHDMNQDCWSIVASLPIHDSDERLFSYLFTSNLVIDKREVVLEYLRQRCLLRYQEILRQLITNNELLYTNARTQLKTPSDQDKHQLIALDMDETLLDQRGSAQRPWIPVASTYHWNIYHTIIAHKHNTEELLFGISKIPNVEPDYAQLIIFRKYLMQFIQRYQQSSIFIIYSLAISKVVIRNVVLIEMYYNYVHQFQVHSTNSEITPFKFDHVIARLSDKRNGTIGMKCLSIMVKLIDMEQFDKIFIVDDMAGNVWTEHIPSMLNNISSKIFAFQAPVFTISLETDAISADAIIGAKAIRNKRLHDIYFYELMRFMERSDNLTIEHPDGELSWITYPVLQQYT